MKEIINSQITSSINVKQAMLKNSLLLADIERAATMILEAYKTGHKTLLAGNGGSAADAQHIAAELVNRLHFDRPGLPSIAITTDTSIITSIGNDYGFEKLFSRQVQAMGTKGDVFIGISTSGNSENIINALIECKKSEIRTIGFTGSNFGKMDEFCDVCIKIPSSDTPRIQEAHILIGHIICTIIEEELFGNMKPKKS